MMNASANFMQWLVATAERCAQTASAAASAASAFEQAFAMTVPPALVAANRAQLLLLIATNVLGQNAPAIAANEAMYAEMWAQDAAAMNVYAASSAAATGALPQFTAAPNTVNPAAAQSTSVTSTLDSIWSGPIGQFLLALVGSGSFTQLPADMLMGLMTLMTADTVIVEQQAAAEAAMRPSSIYIPPSLIEPRIVPPVGSASAGPQFRAQPRVSGRIGGLSVPPGWVTPREGPSVVVNPAPQKFQAGFPVPPAIPVVTAGRSSQSRVRDEPSYGNVSRVMPKRHPSAG